MNDGLLIEDLENGRQKKEGESEELTHLTKEVLKILLLSSGFDIT